MTEKNYAAPAVVELGRAVTVTLGVIASGSETNGKLPR